MLEASPTAHYTDVMLIDIEGLCFAHRQRPVLKQFSLQVRQGEHRLLLGPSGSGKTTLINLIAGLLTPDSGRIMIAGEDMGGAARTQRDDLRRRQIGIVFQTLRLVSALSLKGNLQLAQRLAAKHSTQIDIDDLLQRLGLEARAGFFPRDLSQGEAQRAAVARALVGRPSLLIADEPTSSLDDRNTEIVARLLLVTAAESGTTLLVATHDARLRAHIGNVTLLQTDSR